MRYRVLTALAGLAVAAALAALVTCPAEASAPALRVTSPQAFQVVQRGADGRADIVVRGVSRGLGGRVQARWAGGSWSTGGVSGDGSFAVRLRDCPGGQATLEVRSVRLEKTSPFLSLSFFGTSAEGRPMPLLVASKEKAFTPEAAAKAGKPVVLVLNGIHSGEIDGKDACLILLRDMALGNRPDLLDTVTLLVVPIYNVDGHERVSKWNRPNQDGPLEGMGFRTTTMGYDLNRDFLKADAPETRAWIEGQDRSAKKVTWIVRPSGPGPVRVTVEARAPKAGRDRKTIIIDR